jgi:Outer membrane protein beta-barrel domain
MKHQLLVGAAFVAVSMNLGAQAPAGQSGAPRLGLVAGLNVARLSGSDLQGTQNKTGFGGGVYVAIPVTPSFEIQPELLYTAKGVKASDAGVDAALRLNYVEIPVLARWNFTASSVTPHLYAGPAIAFKTGCTFTASAQGTSISTNCADFQSDQGDPVTFAAVDFGVVAGGGLSFDLGGRHATVGARYNVGLKNIVSSGDAKNRTLSFLASFEVPLPGR